MVAAIASAILAGMGMNSAVYASINGEGFPSFNAGNVGQSLECVIVVVGCDGKGSVGSSGDTIINSNNGNDNDDTNGNGGNGGDVNCLQCLTTYLTPMERIQLGVILGDPQSGGSSIVICEEFASIGPQNIIDAIEQLNLDEATEAELLECLGLK